MKAGYRNWRTNEDGVLIVEATYVFPIVVLVVFLMIYAGNAYLQKCKVESIVTQEVLKGAASCGDPITGRLERGEGLPSFGHLNAQPYRFLIGGMGEDVSAVTGKITEKITGMGGGLFRNMEVEDVGVVVTFNNAFLYSTISADVHYEITLPIRLLGQDEPTVMKFDTRVDVPVSDTVEVIRNIDMIEDYLQRWRAYDEAMGKLDELASTVREKLGIGGH